MSTTAIPVSLDKATQPTVVTRVPGILPFGKAVGRETKRWDTLTLSDGTVVYACNNDGCGRRFPEPKGAFAHLASHKTERTTQVRATRTTAKQLQAAINLIHAAIETETKPEPTDKKVEHWRQRALTAERKLTALRKALSLSD